MFKGTGAKFLTNKDRVYSITELMVRTIGFEKLKKGFNNVCQIN